MFNKVLIANRGAIACRIIRTLRKMKIVSVCIYSEADRDSRHVLDADEAYCIGPPLPSQSYLSIEAILRVAVDSGAKAIHPGYGFLSENISFARACAKAGVVFIGPAIEHIEAFALKHTARNIALGCGVPLLPGTGLLTDKEDALTSASRLGYPVMLKSSAGGGGIGMRVCVTSEQLEDAYESVVRLSKSSFGDGSVYLEKFIARAKHVEVQIFGDGTGGLLTLGARDCSAQRRHQKVIEETPVPGLNPEIQQQLFAASRKLGRAVNYRSAGTVEFLFDVDSNAFYFLEVNTRLQVEHGVTEQVTGLDLVEMMILEAANELPPLDSLNWQPQGSSIEARIYAEDPAKDFQPAPGQLSEIRFPDAALARTETWVERGSEITPYYDPMIAKIIVTGADRLEAVQKIKQALESSSFYGTETNLDYLKAVVSSEAFVTGQMTTSTLGSFTAPRSAFEVIASGTQTTIQDYPGRLGYWNVGVPPSGPMDSLAFRLANRLVDNPTTAPALEMTGIGATLRFDADAVIAITGADMEARLGKSRVPPWTALTVNSGDILQFSAVKVPGCRTYLAIQGGIKSASFLGSASTFMLGRFGGHAGRALRPGDVIHFDRQGNKQACKHMAADSIPLYEHQWELAVLYGPHGSPEFFTEADITMIFNTDWQVHYQSDRTGIRLVGPKPEWARKDGGDAGLHPSNIHDNAYAIGSIDFTGDMPILLGPDGPSLGGFVCPAVVASAELWKLGQMKAGDTVRFSRVTEEQARRLELESEQLIESLTGSLSRVPDSLRNEEAILLSSTAQKLATVYRADGDKYLLIEYGERTLDLALRFRVHLLEQRVRALALPGIIDITPGVRSLQIHYDNRRLPREALLEALEAVDRDLPENPGVTVPSRTVYMPLSWNDPTTRLAQSKYTHSVRPDAPWCPDNIEFIRRINGLASVDEVYEIVHAASYLVLGLGDVYLGAPVATPVDPRHRLVTTKYNPARTWTPENAVGIGGAYMCVYGMEGPGGYQLVGRTVQVWNTHRITKTFPEGTPWSLRFFDQIRFYPVSSEELLDLRSRILYGRFDLRIEDSSFNLRSYQDFLTSVAPQANAFRSKQQDAFREERERWRTSGLLDVSSPPELPEADSENLAIGEGCQAVHAPMTASVFQLAVEPGQRVGQGAKLIVLDAMKTEIVIASPHAGIVVEIRCAPGRLVLAGQILVVMRIV
jgi:urea carboxylase